MKSILILWAAVNSAYFTDQERPQVVEAPVQEVYIPAGFDNNDVTQVIVEGEFPNACYKVGPAQVRVDVDNRQILFQMSAYKYQGSCIQSLNPYLKVLDVGILPEGQYEVLSLKNKARRWGILNVQAAPSKRVDTFDYAAVESMVLTRTDLGDRRVLILSGFHRDSCTDFKDYGDSSVPVYKTSNHVLEVLPIIERRALEGEPCLQVLRPFHKRVELPMDIDAGKYLFHIRTMNGNSINKIDYVHRLPHEAPR